MFKYEYSFEIEFIHPYYYRVIVFESEFINDTNDGFRTVKDIAEYSIYANDDTIARQIIRNTLIWDEKEIIIPKKCQGITIPHNPRIKSLRGHVRHILKTLRINYRINYGVQLPVEG